MGRFFPKVVLPHILTKPARWQKWTPLQKYLAILFKDYRIFLPAFHFLSSARTLFKRVPGARQASTSLKDIKFSLRIRLPFSSSDLAFWCTRHTLFLKTYFLWIRCFWWWHWLFRRGYCLIQWRRDRRTSRGGWWFQCHYPVSIFAFGVL